MLTNWKQQHQELIRMQLKTVSYQMTPKFNAGSAQHTNQCTVTVYTAESISVIFENKCTH